MSKHEELSGIFSRQAWISPDKDYMIGFLEDGTTIKGNVEPGDPQPGLAYRFFGNWKDGDRGRFFQFVCLVKDLPHSRQAVVEYLLRIFKGKATGIGHSAAHKLYDTYQSDAVRKLRMDPKDCSATCGIKLEKARLASEILSEDWRTENTKIELIGLLHGKGFPGSTIKEVIERWGAKAPALIRRDAFCLLTHRIKGAGFARCDRIYLEQNGDPAALKRQTLCAWHALHEDQSGDTWHDPGKCVRAIKEKICGATPNPMRALKLGRRAGWLSVHREELTTWNGTADLQTWIADARKAANESELAATVSRMMKLEPQWPEITSAVLTDHQREKLSISLRGRVGILAGTPGTGKTFTAAAIVQEIAKIHGIGNLEICAPTGKAAVRITESMQRYGLRDICGKTIHRMLQPNGNGHGTGDWGFRYGEREKLPVRFVIVDETSMVDTDLMASLFRACSSSTHILLIGDPYQLPPVGHGAPLRDLIAAGVPCGELSEIKRNDGGIVRACQAIKEGQPFQVARRFNENGPGDNLIAVRADSPAAVFTELQRLVESVKANPKRDVVEDLQILTPLNEASEISRKKINPFLQRLINPGEFTGKNPYRKGDKVICLSNGYYPGFLEMSDFGEPERVNHPVFNGEQGRIEEVTEVYTDMFFQDSEGGRRLRIPLKSEWNSNFDLAYAITVHKSQGSEFPVVIAIADQAAGRIASRELWYTAISRASERCVIFGSIATVQKQCRKQVLPTRKTFLKELISENRKKESEDAGSQDQNQDADNQDENECPWCGGNEIISDPNCLCNQ